MQKITNEMVATEVMEWVDVGCNAGGNILFGCPPDDYNKIYPNNMHRIPVPNYLEEIEPAFWVVDRMKKLGWDMFRLHNNPVKNYWGAYFEKWKFPSMKEGWGKTPMEAICRAAIKVVRKEV